MALIELFLEKVLANWYTLPTTVSATTLTTMAVLPLIYANDNQQNMTLFAGKIVATLKKTPPLVGVGAKKIYNYYRFFIKTIILYHKAGAHGYLKSTLHQEKEISHQPCGL